jgi:hypothetical protein
MPAKKLPPEVLEYFRKQGAKGGRIGGKRAAELMTKQQRSDRARKAVQAREAKRAIRAAAAPAKVRTQKAAVKASRNANEG